MADYIVNYQINVNSQAALNSIKQFQAGVQSLAGMTSTFDLITQKIGSINSSLTAIGRRNPILKINTTQAEASLTKIQGQLQSLKSLANITLTINGGAGKGQASNGLNGITKSLSSLHKSIDNINKRYIHPKVRTSYAQKNLDTLLATLKEIHALSKITLTATGGSRAAASKTAPAAAPAPKAAPIITKIGRQAGHSTLLFPSTRQVLGPTYANTGTNIMGEMVKGMGIAYGLSSLMSGVTSIFRDAVSYDNISQTTKNILGAHDKSFDFEENFREMNDIMRQVGVDTRFTAPQVADAGKYLAMAGYNVGDIKRSIKPITDIALIGDTELGLTADVMTNIMTSYKMPSQQMSRAADILTMTFTKTNTTLLDLAESFKYAGTMAYQSGLSFEESTAAIGVLGDAGIKGSQAGTTLRMMLMNMMNPTKKQKAAWAEAGVKIDDGNGNMRDLTSILGDLSKVRQKMSAYNFAGLISRMFRVTASPGALALINNVEKLQEVSGLNSKSYGLSSELSEAKQNTIQGLWYQMTSAFTEAGMKGFDKMQGAIKGFLQSMIDLMKSDKFIEGIRSAMHTFMEMAKVIASVFQGILGMWNLMPQGLKDLFVQFTKLQMVLGILAGTLQSIMSTWLMIRGIMMGSWLGMGIVKVAGIGTAIWNIARGLHQVYVIQTALFGMSKAQAIWGVAKSIPGAIIGRLSGAVAGSAVAGATGAAVAGGVANMSLMGALLTPIGAGVAASIVAISTLIYKIYKLISLGNETLRINEKLGESFAKFGITKESMSDPDAIIIHNMRIFNSELLTQTERLSKAAEVYNIYYDAKHQRGKKAQDETKFLDTEEGKTLATYWDFINRWGSDNQGKFAPLWKGLGGTVENGQYRVGGMLFGRSLHGNSENPDFSDTEAKNLALYSFGANVNGQYYQSFAKDLISYVGSASSAKNAQENLYAIWKKFIIDPKQNLLPEYTGINGLDRLSKEEVHRLPQVFWGFEDVAIPLLRGWEEFVDLLQDVEKGNDIPLSRVQKSLMSRLGKAFDYDKAKFGTPEWAVYIHDIIQNPHKYNFDNDKKAIESIVTSFKLLTDLYNSSPQQYKHLYAPFLNRTIWESVLPNPELLPVGGFIAGDKLGDGKNKGSRMTSDGKVFEWKLMNNWGIPMWLDKNNSPLTPKDSRNIFLSPTGEYLTKDELELRNQHKEDMDINKYSTISSAPKQVIVRIENLMNVENVDMTDERKAAVVTNLKEEMAQALLEVVAGFSSDLEG